MKNFRMTSKINLEQVLRLEETIGARELYGSENQYKSTPKAVGIKGVRVNMTQDIQEGLIDTSNYGCGELILRQTDLEESKVKNPT